MRYQDIKRYTRANLEAWDETAPIHKRHNQSDLLEAFAAGDHNTLDKHCLEPLLSIGIAGKRVAQVCCNNGRELISLRNMGAVRCVGFDGSAPFLDQARELAAAAGHSDIEFVTTDIYDIDPAYQQSFDLVLVTIGVISWMPDIEGFFARLAGLLSPGGYLFIEDIHPVLMMYEQGKDELPSYLAYSYFKDTPYEEVTGLDYYSGETYESKPNYSFQHTLASIFTAALNNRLQLRHFAELPFDISTLCADLEHAEIRPPMGMTQLWQKGR